MTQQWQDTQELQRPPGWLAKTTGGQTWKPLSRTISKVVLPANHEKTILQTPTNSLPHYFRCVYSPLPINCTWFYSKTTKVRQLQYHPNHHRYFFQSLTLYPLQWDHQCKHTALLQYMPLMYSHIMDSPPVLSLTETHDSQPHSQKSSALTPPDQPKYQHHLPSPNWWPIRMNKSMARTVPLYLHQLPPEQLGTVATTSTIHTQLMAQLHYKESPIWTHHGTHPMCSPTHTGLHIPICHRQASTHQSMPTSFGVMINGHIYSFLFMVPCFHPSLISLFLLFSYWTALLFSLFPVPEGCVVPGLKAVLVTYPGLDLYIYACCSVPVHSCTIYTASVSWTLRFRVYFWSRYH